MNLLAIDASSECASVALMNGAAIRCEEQPAQRQHAQVILPLIEGLLAEAGLSLPQLDGVVFGRGPGSFTGLRIACSVAKGLACAHDLPMYPVSGLASIVNEFQHRHPAQPEQTVLAVIDARMNQLYWSVSAGTRSGEEQVSDPVAVHVSGQEPVVLAGCGYEAYQAQFPPELGARIQQMVTLYPGARAMLRLVASGSVAACSAADALPVYIRNQIVQGDHRG